MRLRLGPARLRFKIFLTPGKFYLEDYCAASARERGNLLGTAKAGSCVLSFCTQSCPKAAKFLGSFTRLRSRIMKPLEKLGEIDRVKIQYGVGLRFVSRAAPVSTLRVANPRGFDPIGRRELAAFEPPDNRVNIARPSKKSEPSYTFVHRSSVRANPREPDASACFDRQSARPRAGRGGRRFSRFATFYHCPVRRARFFLILWLTKISISEDKWSARF